MGHRRRKPTRREFLRRSAAAAAGVTLGGGLSIEQAAHAAGSDELQVALIGCGGRGTGAVKDCLAADPNIKLVAVADAFADNASRCVDTLRKQEDIAARIDVAPDCMFAGFDAYQKAIAAEPDIVLLAAPPGFRPLHYAAAVAAGKHVFMEKPCCIDAAGFRSAMETNKLADEKDLKVVVGLQRRYDQGYLDEIKRIHDGEIGNLLFLRAYWNGTEPWFRRRQLGQTEMEYQMRNWYHFLWLCGDCICEQHVHNLDICNWAKDAHPVEANGMGGCNSRYKIRDPKTGSGQIFDHHFVEFTYADGAKLYSQCRQADGAWEVVGEAAHGAKGVSKCTVKDYRGAGYREEQVALLGAIRNNEKHNDGWFGTTSSFTGVLGRMASYSGQVVKWDEAVEKGASEMPIDVALSFDAAPPAKPDENGCYPIPIPGVYRAY